MKYGEKIKLQFKNKLMLINSIYWMEITPRLTFLILFLKCKKNAKWVWVKYTFMISIMHTNTSPIIKTPKGNTENKNMKCFLNS